MSQASTEGTLKTIASTVASTSSTLSATGECPSPLSLIAPSSFPPNSSLPPTPYPLPPHLSPSSSHLRLKPLDIEFMKQLHNLVNIIPVIAKADMLTPKEIKALKMKVCSIWSPSFSNSDIPCLTQSTVGCVQRGLGNLLRCQVYS